MGPFASLFRAHVLFHALEALLVEEEVLVHVRDHDVPPEPGHRAAEAGALLRVIEGLVDVHAEVQVRADEAEPRRAEVVRHAEKDRAKNRCSLKTQCLHAGTCPLLTAAGRRDVRAVVQVHPKVFVPLEHSLCLSGIPVNLLAHLERDFDQTQLVERGVPAFLDHVLVAGCGINAPALSLDLKQVPELLRSLLQFLPERTRF